MQTARRLILSMTILASGFFCFETHAQHAGPGANVTQSELKRFHNGRFDVLKSFGDQLTDEGLFGNCGLTRALRISKSKVESQTWEKTIEEAIRKTGEQALVEFHENDEDSIKRAALSLANKHAETPSADQRLALKTAQSLLAFALRSNARDTQTEPPGLEKPSGLYSGRVQAPAAVGYERELGFFALVDYTHREMLILADGTCD